MDGFALFGNDSVRTHYTIVGACYPGQLWHAPIEPGQAVRIMTGAAVPPGADRVIPFELAEQSGDQLRISQDRPARSHIRPKGSDMREGQVVLAPGTMLDPRALLVAGAADVGEVRTWRRPVVSVVSSGDELALPGEACERAWAIPDSLSEAILLLARQYDAKPGSATLVPDNAAAILQACDAMLGSCDILVLIGGASRGDRDHSKAALASLDLRLCFADVAMKPGKPVWYGRIGETHVIGLPGNPTAAMTTARLFLVPLIRALGGRDLAGALVWRPRPLLSPSDANGDRESFLCGTRSEEGIHILERQSASSQRMLAVANVLVRVPANAPARLEGETVETLSF
jgi:molybdopterin molybdotransferase